MSFRTLIEPYLPTSFEELYPAQIVSMLAFAVVATVLANRRKQPGQRVDFHYIARSTAAGVTFPVSILLVFYPVVPSVQTLFSMPSVSIYLSVAGCLTALLTFYSLIR